MGYPAKEVEGPAKLRSCLGGDNRVAKKSPRGAVVGKDEIAGEPHEDSDLRCSEEAIRAELLHAETMDDGKGLMLGSPV